MQKVKLRQLAHWPANPRVTQDSESIARIKASILAGHGLLQNLITVPNKAVGDVTADEGQIVIAGDTRFQSLKELEAEDKIDGDYEIWTKLMDIDIDDADALEIALTENIVRSNMDAIDECVAMAELARLGRKVEAIAASFGYTVKTVKQRMALGRLIPEAQALVRASERDLDWAKAMSLADKATQVQICNEIESSPLAWKDGATVRRWLTDDTIPAEHALFNYKKIYRGTIIYDMFDGDMLKDRAEFWEHQNAAVENLRDEIEKEGYREVAISHQPVDTWRFHRGEAVGECVAIVEVSPNGKVVVHRDLMPINDEEPLVNEIEEEVNASEAVSGDQLRMTPAMQDYVAAHRSALVQQALLVNPKKALEVTIAGMIGHAEIAVRAQDYRFPGSPEIRVSHAFGEIARLRDGIADRLADAGITTAEDRNQAILTYLAGLDEAELLRLLAELTASKVGQVGTRGIDDNPASLLNRLGVEMKVDVRQGWMPDETFFKVMSAPDLKRLAMALLPDNRKNGIYTASKRNLVSTLADAFADAAEMNGTMDPVDADRLNAWIPGPLMFPGTEGAEAAEKNEDGGDAFAALFSGAEKKDDAAAEAEAQVLESVA